MEQLNKITLSGREYPIKCSNFVLAEIQAKYGELSKFEDLLSGRKAKYDDNGNRLRDEDGNAIFEKTDISMDAINFFLPLIINEGLEIEAIEKNKPAEIIDSKTIIRMIDVNPFTLSLELLMEFYRAFNIKK